SAVLSSFISQSLNSGWLMARAFHGILPARIARLFCIRKIKFSGRVRLRSAGATIASRRGRAAIRAIAPIRVIPIPAVAAITAVSGIG
ncbi:MAG: hypothetical protein E7J78_16645, partial [Pantoea sp.]|nr:hypothetical protein [Pantoea sp.]